jgi:uncharacterized protein with NRDE domain
VCTVLLWADPSAPWPLVVGAIRDEFVARAWDPPAAHWDGRWAGFLGGRDRTAGGTWLAVDPSPTRPAVAALLNGGPPLPALADGSTRPTRGDLALRALAGDGVPEPGALARYDRFHLLLATAASQELWSWDGESLEHVALPPGPHIVVNAGLDTDADPLVPHFLPLLAAVARPALDVGAWGGWPELLSGDGLRGDDERALLVAKDIEGRAYGSTSGALVALAADGRVRYEFTATPADASSWSPVG